MDDPYRTGPPPAARVAGWRRWLRHGLPGAVFSGWRWYRRLAGGHWEGWWVDAPVGSFVWIPQDEGCCGKRPGLARGRPTCEDWPKPGEP